MNANIYITPPNSQGFSVHSDTHDVILLQIDGHKSWRIQRELEFLATPRDRSVTTDPTMASEWDDLRIIQGEALYMPRGLLHEGVAGSRHSLHVTLGIHPYTWGDLVRDVISRLEHAHELFRKAACLPSTSLEENLSMVESKISEVLGSPEVVAELFADRDAGYRATSFRGRFARFTQLPELSTSTRVRVRDQFDPQLRHVGDEIELQFASKALTFPSYVAPQLEEIVRRQSVTLRELPPSLDDAGKVVLCAAF